MLFSRNNGATHFLAVASATTAVVGIQFDDVKWAVSVGVSLFGSAIALYIFRGEMRANAETLKGFHAELDRRRTEPETATEHLRRVRVTGDIERVNPVSDAGAASDVAP
jgi:hypothetical protein